MSAKGKKRNIIIGTIFAILMCAGIFAAAILKKVIVINELYIAGDAVVGVDISHYQGKVDMAQLHSQNISFAYIKATEGSESVDEQFAENWKNGEDSKLYIGAYHFFSFDSSGKRQAKHFIKTVGDLGGKLVPVADVEYYGNREKNPPDKKTLKKELTEFLDTLEEEYGVKPMIYTTQKVYAKYIRDSFADYPLWLRSVYYPVQIVVGNRWAFWQYSDSKVLEGYHGKEQCIDMNVFHGSKEELEKMVCE